MSSRRPAPARAGGPAGSVSATDRRPSGSPAYHTTAARARPRPVRRRSHRLVEQDRHCSPDGAMPPIDVDARVRRHPHAERGDHWPSTSPAVLDPLVGFATRAQPELAHALGQAGIVGLAWRALGPAQPVASSGSRRGTTAAGSGAAAGRRHVPTGRTLPAAHAARATSAASLPRQGWRTGELERGGHGSGAKHLCACLASFGPLDYARTTLWRADAPTPRGRRRTPARGPTARRRCSRDR